MNYHASSYLDYAKQAHISRSVSPMQVGNRQGFERNIQKPVDYTISHNPQISNQRNIVDHRGIMGLNSSRDNILNKSNLSSLRYGYQRGSIDKSMVDENQGSRQNHNKIDTNSIIFKDSNDASASRHDTIVSKQSRYSPLRQVYNESRSPSVISHMNTSINESLRQSINADKEVTRLSTAYAGITDANVAKLQQFVANLLNRVEKVSGARQKATVSELEIDKLNRDMGFFNRKTEMARRWLQEMRSKIEDREMTYRQLYKISKQPGGLTKGADYILKKAVEIESESVRMKDSLKVRKDLYDRELNELETEANDLDRKLKEKDMEWIIRDHQHTIMLEQEARDEMNSRSYRIVLEHFRRHQNNSKFGQIYGQLEELIKIRQFYKDQYDESKLLSDEKMLSMEVKRLESIKAARMNKSQFDKPEFYYARR